MLIALFALIPYLRMNGKPLILLDVVPAPVHAVRDDVLPTDTVLLMLLLVGIFLAIFWLTAVYGRVWLAGPARKPSHGVPLPTHRAADRGRNEGQSDLIGAAGRSGGSSSTRSSWEFSMFLAHTFSPISWGGGAAALGHALALEHPRRSSS